ncbi:MAG: fibronectin/fibrinogen-binding protein [Lachnospiraceae bacterium]|nr:fibronectin/fibrinogen-binding protein [Lachnospiraceae bacterium]
MAFDGITVSSLISEFNKTLDEGRIYKIAQTESDELMITFKANKSQYKMLLSVNASLPLAYFTNEAKPSPMTAPNFCMLLRKHINSGRIVSIKQPGLERIIDFELQHLDEMGDVCIKHLIIELMGKHSNIIFCDDKNMIVDSIKHISSVMSSVRQVLPGREYFIPDTMNKENPLTVDRTAFDTVIYSKACNLSKAIYTSLTGISPVIAEEICYRANVDSSLPATVIEDGAKDLIWSNFAKIIGIVKSGEFSPVIYEKDGSYVEFNAFPLLCYADCNEISFDSMSELLESFYKKKNESTRIKQKSFDLRRIVNTALEKDNKKYALQLKQLKDTEKKDKYKVYGELLTTYGYSVEAGSKECECENFYTGETVKIPLDPTLTPIENAKKYFDKYAKLKRTGDALSSIVLETKASIDYLETISVSLDIAQNETDLKEIKNELVQTGYIKKRSTNKKERFKSKPLHFISTGGYHMYVGKNNIQNEELTFKVANGGDWWFHSKAFPGSHVIVKTNGDELPDIVFEEAARLAAHFSKGSGQEKVEIDYTMRKNVKKVAGAMPGFVIYHTNYSMAISPDISGIEEIK